MTKKFPSLPYNPQQLPREMKKYYISANDNEIKEMLTTMGLSSVEDMYQHIPNEIRFKKAPSLPPALQYFDLIKHLKDLSQKNNRRASFIGDGLPWYKTPPIIPFVSNIRGLSTAYTPYQPERGQGTLHGLWIYSSILSMLTGLEAINASLYDRASGLYEAFLTAMRLKAKRDTILLLESIYPGDIKVVRSLAAHTHLKIKTIPINPDTGQTDAIELQKMVKENRDNLAAISFCQVNSLGNLEDVDLLTDLAHLVGAKAIAIIDPMHITTGGLKPPSDFGEKGADILVGEGQHLAIAPNFGGPGLGIFGIRHNSSCKTDIRATPGRYVGKTKDHRGKDALTMILSTREQHIRRQKATSNICSNQSFMATLVGAGILCRGEKGMLNARQKARDNALWAAQKLSSFTGVKPAFPQTPFYNEITFKLPVGAKELIKKASASGIHLGVSVGERLKDSQDRHLLISFFDIHGEKDLEKLESFFSSQFSKSNPSSFVSEIPSRLLRKKPVGLPSVSLDSLKKFYQDLGDQNISPDNAIYPLGSCTMKYNPYINDYCASLKGFTDIHPQAPEEDCQGALQLLFAIQEMFKKITGLHAVTTQPVAGAQGELVGLKMFQAWHHDHKKEGEPYRDLILIPRSAHGTNPATATMAGYRIVTIEANDKGQIDWNHLRATVRENKERIAGIMITNPNTSGIFEEDFKKISTLIHQTGGLVYMDGANMNAIAGHVDLSSLGVDAVHNNLHKTWTIPHGGGGPGDAIVAVSTTLKDYLPGVQVVKDNDIYRTTTPKKSIGSIHRHFGNFAHKIRCYTYLRALGGEGVQKMSEMAVLSAKYLQYCSREYFPGLPENTDSIPRMHEFILTINKEMFARIERAGIPKAQAIAKIGKLFLDFGLHAPTVSFPETLGLMIEPTESFSKKELDRFVEILKAIHLLINEHPEVLTTTPHFTPVGKIDEISANKSIKTWENIENLPLVSPNKISPEKLATMSIGDITREIIKTSQSY
ncbi:MAG: aminomethyl-transferring glycine dehydrogenase subunit GcvPB [Halobacteriovoraceae bacterium]|nr:aminomethyl-transferring glycine dehydrogenase subunit GcvPB [Halobacteriovoraceae bacterium]